MFFCVSALKRPAGGSRLSQNCFEIFWQKLHRPEAPGGNLDGDDSAGRNSAEAAGGERMKDIAFSV